MPNYFWETRWDPFREIEELKRRMDRLFQEELGGRRTWFAGVYPLVNISEDDDHIYVRAELPGVKAEDLEIHLKDQNLVLRGEKRIPATEKGVNYHRRERESGFFRRVVTLPRPVDPDKVEATCQDGILTIRLAKPEAVKPRKITVKSA
jgi:HSP20 family protein